jgi:hypothetical protein
MLTITNRPCLSALRKTRLHLSVNPPQASLSYLTLILQHQSQSMALYQALLMQMVSIFPLSSPSVFLPASHHDINYFCLFFFIKI